MKRSISAPICVVRFVAMPIASHKSGDTANPLVARLYPLERQRDALADADAERDQRALAAGLLELMDRG